MRSLRTLLMFVSVFIASIAKSQDLQLLKSTFFPKFSSSSSLDLFDHKLYVIGDDAPYMMILDMDHNLVDTVQLFHTKDKRLRKEDKPDLESSVIIRSDQQTYFYAISSFSTATRDKLVRLELNESGKAKGLNVSTCNFHPAVPGGMNIEGASLINGKLVLSNRANFTSKVNYLLVTEMAGNSLKEEGTKIIPVQLPDNSKIIGISGMSYIPEKDMLLFSASTEETTNAYSDGTIGESYIGYISNISTKLDSQTIQPDRLVPLSQYLKQKKPQKIESIVAEDGNASELIIHLAADNDNGTSTIFKMKWRL